RDEERGNLAGPAVEQRLVLALDRAEPADAGPDRDADVRRDLGRHGELRVIHRELRRRNRVLDERVHLLDVLLLDEVQRLEAADLAGNTRRELRDVEPADGVDAARA